MAYGDLPYGEGLYKGIGSLTYDLPVSDLYFDPNRCCLVLGYAQEHGGGWSERSGDNWIWPSSPASVLQVFNGDRQLYNIALDSRDGMFYILNPNEDNDVEAPYLDKYDQLVEGSGETIEWDIHPGEITGEMRHYTVFDLDTHLKLRAPWLNRYSEDGYTARGLRDEFTLRITTRQDGIPVDVSTINDVPLGQELIHEREVNGESFQTLLHGEDSFFRLMNIEQYCKVQDKPKNYDNGSDGQTEDQLQSEMATPVVWLSRPLLLINRASGRAITGTATAITGPDSRSGSAFRLSVATSLGNSSIVSGTLLLWHYGAGYTIPGVTLAEVSSGLIGGWRLLSATSAFLSNIMLQPGDLFDVRLYATALSAAAIEYYRENVVNHDGDVFLP